MVTDVQMPFGSMVRFMVRKTGAVGVLLTVALLGGCGPHRYKNWAIEQTYGQVPCVTLTVDDVFDDSDVPALGDAPLASWIVVCKQRAYLCSYREESAGWVSRLNWGPSTVDEERRCILLDDPPPEIKRRLIARQATSPQ